MARVQDGGLFTLPETLPAVPPEAVDTSQAGDRPGPLSGSARAFLVLLRVVGASGQPDWGATLYAFLFYGVLSWGAVLMIYGHAEKGLAIRGTTGDWLAAAVSSGFFGVMPLVSWATLTVTFVCGRRRYGELLVRLQEALQEAEELLSTADRAGPDLTAWAVWTIVILTTAANIAVSGVYMGTSGICHSLTVECAKNAVTLMGLFTWVFSLISHGLFTDGSLLFSWFHSSLCLLVRRWPQRWRRPTTPSQSSSPAETPAVAARGWSSWVDFRRVCQPV